MDNPYSVLANNEEGAQKDVVDFFKFSSLVPDVKVELNDSNFHSDKYKKFPSLLVCSSKYGFFVTGSRSGFQLGQTKLLRDAIYKTDKSEVVPFNQVISVPIQQGLVDVLALTSDNLQLIVGVSGGLLLTYNINDIVKNKEETTPVQTYTLESEITYIQPNPEVYRDVIAVLTENKECRLIRYMSNEVIATVSNVTSVCWSPLGKQFVCGTTDGLIEAYDISGQKKDTIDPPQSQKGMLVNAVIWVESHIFLAIYADGEQSHTPYIIKRKLEDPSEKYTLLDEVNPIYNFECPDSHFYYTIIRNFGKEIKTLITLANTAAGDLAIVGQSEDGEWATWIMGETSISLPLSDDDVLDTYPVGLAVDFSASEPLAPYDSAESEAPVPPMPVIMFMTNEGRLCAYHAYNFDLAKNGINYENMVEAPQDLNTIPLPAGSTQAPKASTVAAGTGFGSFGGEAPSNIPAFSSFGSAPVPKANPNIGNTTTSSAPAAPTFGLTSNVGFGSSGFGNTTSTEQKVSFASLAKASTAIPAPPRPSAFGFNPEVTTPAFGQSSGFGMMNSSENTPTLGSTTAFGQTSTIGQAAAPAFAKQTLSFDSKNQIESPFKAKSFGSTSSNTSTVATKPFGETSFAPASIDVDTLIKKTSEEPIEKLKEQPTEDTAGAKSMFGLPSAEKKKENDECSFSFESVKKDLDIDNGDSDDAGSEISKVSSIDKSKDAFGLSLVSDALDDDTSSHVKKYNQGERNYEVDEASDSDYEPEDDEDDEDDDDLVVVREGKLDEVYFPEKKKNTGVEDDQSSMFEKKKDDRDSEQEVPEETTDTKTNREKTEVSHSEDKIHDQEKVEASNKEKHEEKSSTEKRHDEDAATQKEISNDAPDTEKKESHNVEDDISKDMTDAEKEQSETLTAEEKQVAEEKAKRDEEERTAKEEENKRAEEAKRLEEERIAEEKRSEEQRIAEEKRRVEEARRREEARLDSMRQTPVLLCRERVNELTLHKRAVGIKGIAKDFESAYFDTVEDLESTTILIDDIKEDISIHIKNDFTMIGFSSLEDLEFEWMMDDMYDIEGITNDLNEAAKDSQKDLLELRDAVSKLLESTNNLKLEEVRSCLETRDDLENLKSTLEDDATSQIDSLEAKSFDYIKMIEELDGKISKYKQQLNAHKSISIDESKLTMYSLRRTIRDIERSISVQIKKINALEQEELSLRQSKSQPSNDPIATVYNTRKSDPAPRMQRKTFLDQMFRSTQQFKPLNV